MIAGDLHIREMAETDLDGVRPLMQHLGYDIAADELARRFAAVAATDGHQVFLAERAGAVLGLVHVFFRPALEKPVEAIIQAMVVHEDHQCLGIGRKLMTQAEDWARAEGLPSVYLHTNVIRDHARAFYAKLGYAEISEAAALRKNLAS